MGLIKDIRSIIQEYRTHEALTKDDLCNQLETYIEQYAKDHIKSALDYQKKTPGASKKTSAKWKKDHPEEYKVQQREYKRKVNGYYEKHSKEILSKADDSLKDKRDAEIIEIGIDVKDKEPNDE